MQLRLAALALLLAGALPLPAQPILTPAQRQLNIDSFEMVWQTVRDQHWDPKLGGLIIGTRTAGAALPSVFTRLPNGDGFQYAIANYISEGGQPLEGFGVTPDQEVKLTRHQLLEGQDPVRDAAVTWIEKQKSK